MALDNPKISANMVTEYQASGIPWVTGSLFLSGVSGLQFPFVTRDITLMNSGPSDIFVGFSENGVLGSNRMHITSGSSFTGALRIKALWLSSSANANVSIIAGMTRIPWSAFPVLTGSDGFLGIG